jgi:hypothetical protein
LYLFCYLASLNPFYLNISRIKEPNITPKVFFSEILKILFIFYYIFSTNFRLYSDPPRHVPRVDILRELAVVPVPAGGHDPQLEKIREMQARLDEGAGTLEPIRRDIGQEWAGQPPAGEVRHLP